MAYLRSHSPAHTSSDQARLSAASTDQSGTYSDGPRLTNLGLWKVQEKERLLSATNNSQPRCFPFYPRHTVFNSSLTMSLSHD